MKRVRRVGMFTLLFLTGAVCPVSAAIIVQDPGNSFSGVTNQNQALSKLVVGASDVALGGFGVYGKSPAGGNLKFVIFDSTSPNSPLYTSPLVAIEASPAARWYDISDIDVTLLASHSYAMGVISDRVGSSTFNWGSTFSAFGGGTTISGGGVSLPFMQSLVDSGLVNGALAKTPKLYTVDNSNRYRMSLRVMSAELPEPSVAGLLACGLLPLLRRNRPSSLG